MKIRTKICGLKTEDAVIAAQDNGAEFLGFIFYPPSPRHISPAAAGKLAKVATAKKIAVIVDADDALLDAIVAELRPDYIQLHGSETDERAKEIKTKYNIPLVRARHPDQVSENPELYEFLLFDAPNGGGKGIPFDWKKFTPPKQQWFLSGGMKVENLEEAIRTTGANMLDVSSGVESAPGVKDLEKIRIFLKKASLI